MSFDELLDLTADVLSLNHAGLEFSSAINRTYHVLPVRVYVENMALFVMLTPALNCPLCFLF